MFGKSKMKVYENRVKTLEKQLAAYEELTENQGNIIDRQDVLVSDIKEIYEECRKMNGLLCAFVHAICNNELHTDHYELPEDICNEYRWRDVDISVEEYPERTYVCKLIKADDFELSGNVVNDSLTEFAS